MKKKEKFFGIQKRRKVHAVAEEDYVALPYNSMERPVIRDDICHKHQKDLIKFVKDL